MRKTQKNLNLVEPYVGSDGRLKVFLYDKDGNGSEKDLAYLVAVAFPEICGKPVEGKLPSFKNGDKTCCKAANLYWED